MSHAPRHSRRLLPLILVISMTACERPADKAPPTQPAMPTALRDWVMHPPAAAARDSAAPPLRVLSAAPNVTEICYALGLGDRLVGRTRYCAHPPAVSEVPSMGDLYNVGVEVLLELEPELIVISGQSRSIRDRLERLSLAFLTLPDESIADLETGLRELGARTGRAEAAAELATGIRADLAAVAKRFEDVPARRVLIVLAPLSDPPTPPYVAGPGSFYDDLLVQAGHANMAVTAGRPFAPLSIEFIVQADPDVVIELVPDDTQRPGGDADARRVWGQLGRLSAVKNERVHVLRGHQHLILGPRVAHTFEALCRIIAAHEAPE